MHMHFLRLKEGRRISKNQGGRNTFAHLVGTERPVNPFAGDTPGMEPFDRTRGRESGPSAGTTTARPENPSGGRSPGGTGGRVREGATGRDTIARDSRAAAKDLAAGGCNLQRGSQAHVASKCGAVD